MRNPAQPSTLGKSNQGDEENAVWQLPIIGLRNLSQIESKSRCSLARAFYELILLRCQSTLSTTALATENVRVFHFIPFVIAITIAWAVVTKAPSSQIRSKSPRSDTY